MNTIFLDNTIYNLIEYNLSSTFFKTKVLPHNSFNKIIVYFYLLAILKVISKYLLHNVDKNKL